MGLVTMEGEAQTVFAFPCSDMPSNQGMLQLLWKQRQVRLRARELRCWLRQQLRRQDHVRPS